MGGTGWVDRMLGVSKEEKLIILQKMKRLNKCKYLASFKCHFLGECTSTFKILQISQVIVLILQCKSALIIIRCGLQEQNPGEEIIVPLCLKTVKVFGLVFRAYHFETAESFCHFQWED